MPARTSELDQIIVGRNEHLAFILSTMNAVRRGVASAEPLVLVVEDDASVRFGICGVLRGLGFQVLEAASYDGATRAFRRGIDAVITDLRLPDGDAMALMAQIRTIDPTTAVFIVTGYGTIDVAVRALKQGAEDFLTKPVNVKALGDMVRRAVERRRSPSSDVRPKLRPARCFEPVSSAMKRVEEEVETLRDASCSVLLLGETGTGKSMLARRIHTIGSRGAGPFVDINCAGLSKELVESELFGHERGAFTGANAAKQGLFEVANGGTLFLDEIGDVDLQVQPKLLKALEEKRFRRMGDVKERSVDVRLVAATHHDLLGAVARKTFRADLYYRISTVSITLPRLRERREDLVPLAYHFLAEQGADDVELSVDAKRALLEHAWPGNLRELKNVLERAVLLRSGNVIRADNLRFDTPSERRIAAAVEAPPSSSEAVRTLRDVKREHIRNALVAEQGRVEAAARRLGIPRSTLYQRIKEYGLQDSTSRAKRSPSDPPRSDN